MGFDLGGESTPTIKFERVGDFGTGKIIEISEVQQTDLDSGEPAFWQSGQPKMMVRMILQTDLRDPGDSADTGRRAIYLKGSRKRESQSSLAAVLEAVRQATGGTAVDPGGTITLRYVADGERTHPAFNPPKKYQASYQPPSLDLGGGQDAPQRPPEAPRSSPQSQTAQTYSGGGSGASGGAQGSPGVNAVDTVVGYLDGKPIALSQAAAMRSAGVPLDSMPTWRPVQSDEPPF